MGLQFVFEISPYSRALGMILSISFHHEIGNSIALLNGPPPGETVKNLHSDLL